MARFNKSAWAVVGLVGLAAGGCESSPAVDAGGVRPDVTDIRPLGHAVMPVQPIEPPTAVPASYDTVLCDTTGVIPTAPQPITPAAQRAATVLPAELLSTDVAPTPDVSTPTAPIAPGANHRQTHVVRRGETLFSIARASYGDGRRWRKLAAANPAASGGSLRVGQQIVIP